MHQLTPPSASIRLAQPRLESAHPLAAAYIIVAALTVMRGIFAMTIELRVDEAYYWTWSKEHVISFLDHPPLIAWLIRFSTSILGDTNLGVRFPGLLAMALTQLLLADIVWRMVRDLRYVAAVILMTEAALAYGLGMAKITPDVALIPCELAMFWALIRLAQSSDLRWWLAAGLFGGLALLTKYTAVLFVPAIAAFVLIPHWRKRQLGSIWLWLGLGIALVVFSPVLCWNAAHDWASFRFQLGREPQVEAWSARFLVDFVGQQFALVGILLLPMAVADPVFLLARGYRERAPIPILLSSAVLFPLGFFLCHGLTARIGDSWLLFVWPIAFACVALNTRDALVRSPWSLLARTRPVWLVTAIASGIVLAAAAQVYYILGTANYLKRDDPIGKEAGYAEVVEAAEASRNATGARWFATSDYRIYSLLRWHLRDTAVPIIQVNERRR